MISLANTCSAYGDGRTGRGAPPDATVYVAYRRARGRHRHGSRHVAEPATGCPRRQSGNIIVVEPRGTVFAFSP
jgi:hypothetical protein